MKDDFNGPSKRLFELLKLAKQTSYGAGAILQDYYKEAETSSTVLAIEIKDDNSPVTAADKASHTYIVEQLSQATPEIPVISEENKKQPIVGDTYWTVDPLDGTKEFLHRTGGFSVKIALVHEGQPVLGCVYCPAQDVMYFSYEGGHAFRQDGNDAPRRIRTKPKDKGDLRILFNEKHANKDAYMIARDILSKKGQNITDVPDGVAGLPRNLRIAEGLADMFVDCGGDESLENGCGYSWDYAPDYLILKNAGGVMKEIISGKEPDFKEPCSRRNAYIAFRDKRLGTKLFP